jgi:hypothetical protein
MLDSRRIVKHGEIANDPDQLRRENFKMSDAQSQPHLPLSGVVVRDLMRAQARRAYAISPTGALM